MTATQQFSDISFAERLKQLRKAAGLNQYELADAIKINQALISRYENGLTPKAEHITKLAEFFQADFNQFETEPDDPVITEITRLILQLPEPKQVEVLEFTRFKVKSLVACV